MHGSDHKRCLLPIASLIQDDFESSVPLSMFLSVLYDLELLEKENHSEYVSKIKESEDSTVKIIKSEFKIDLNPYKLELAEMIAEKINKKIWSWWQDEKFNKTELGQFLTFVQSII